jgi:hypothetical protein
MNGFLLVMDCRNFDTCAVAQTCWSGKMDSYGPTDDGFESFGQFVLAQTQIHQPKSSSIGGPISGWKRPCDWTSWGNALNYRRVKWPIMKNPPMFLQIYNSHERSNQKSPQFPWIGFRGNLQENPENLFLFRVETMVCYRCTSKSPWSSVMLINFPLYNDEYPKKIWYHRLWLIPKSYPSITQFL